MNAFVFLLSAEREFQSVLLRLGHDEWTADLRAFQLTRVLAARVQELESLWSVARAEKEGGK